MQEQISKVLQSVNENEIPLHLNTYDDIFSDFDPRQYNQKALSDDFLAELKRASQDKTGVIDLKLLVPAVKRSINLEVIIKRRLKEHFKRHFTQLRKERMHIIKDGIALVLMGVVLMVLATLVLFKYKRETILTDFLVVFLEPGGWFFFWEGLYQIIFESKIRTPDFKFYRKMSDCRISFIRC